MRVLFAGRVSDGARFWPDGQYHEREVTGKDVGDHSMGFGTRQTNQDIGLIGLALFRGVDRDERVNEFADGWRRLLLERFSAIEP